MSGGEAQVVECSPSKCEDLNSNPSISIKKEKSCPALVAHACNPRHLGAEIRKN
jgi:hypothetical protein